MMLMDSAEIYKVEVEAARRMHPNDIDVYKLEDKVMKTIQKLFQREGNLNNQKQKKDKNEGVVAEKDHQVEEKNEAPLLEKELQQQENCEPPVVEEDKEQNLNENEIENAEIDPEELDMIELIEYINSTQGRKDMEQYEEEMSIPSFSLGIDNPVIDICKEINKEHSVEEEPQANIFITPAPEKKEQRAKREAKLGPAYRSPYVRREIDMNEKYSVQDYAIWRWIIQKEKNK